MPREKKDPFLYVLEYLIYSLLFVPLLFFNLDMLMAADY